VEQLLIFKNSQEHHPSQVSQEGLYHYLSYCMVNEVRDKVLNVALPDKVSAYAKEDLQAKELH